VVGQPIQEVKSSLRVITFAAVMLLSEYVHAPRIWRIGLIIATMLIFLAVELIPRCPRK
jgi:hypothetical protein